MATTWRWSVPLRSDPHEPIPMIGLVWRVAIALAAAAALVAAIVRLGALSGQVRSWLDYPFRLPATPRVALGIFANNSRALIGLLGLVLIAQLAARAPGGPAQAQRLALAFGELILAGGVIANVLIVGGAVGAYGERMVLALLPHGPVEAAAYAYALAFYVSSRTTVVPARRVIQVAATSTALLAVSAVLETFVRL